MSPVGSRGVCRSSVFRFCAGGSTDKSIDPAARFGCLSSALGDTRACRACACLAAQTAARDVSLPDTQSQLRAFLDLGLGRRQLDGPVRGDTLVCLARRCLPELSGHRQRPTSAQRPTDFSRSSGLAISRSRKKGIKHPELVEGCGRWRGYSLVDALFSPFSTSTGNEPPRHIV